MVKVSRPRVNQGGHHHGSLVSHPPMYPPHATALTLGVAESCPDRGRRWPRGAYARQGQRCTPRARVRARGVWSPIPMDIPMEGANGRMRRAGEAISPSGAPMPMDIPRGGGHIPEDHTRFRVLERLGMHSKLPCINAHEKADVSSNLYRQKLAFNVWDDISQER